MFAIFDSDFGFNEKILILVFFVFAVLFSLILHEIAHGYVALKCGDPTAKAMGRLSFNPKKHLDPIGTICFLLFGLGWARPVPINPNNFRNYKLGCFLVSLAGIVMNLILGFIFSFFFALCYQNAGAESIWTLIFYYAMSVNICFAIFNLLPIPPLDGFNILASFFSPWNKTIQWMRQNSFIIFIVFIIIMDSGNFIGTAFDFVANIFLKLWEVVLPLK
ncbi:MAG: site-2 protease family protein [Christensenellaceae bacterium]|jgi:Zn-dependent protease|nr:site-2 protease family protein [Christensenellaceae bacterium]